MWAIIHVYLLRTFTAITDIFVLNHWRISSFSSSWKPQVDRNTSVLSVAFEKYLYLIAKKLVYINSNFVSEWNMNSPLHHCILLWGLSKTLRLEIYPLERTNEVLHLYLFISLWNCDTYMEVYTFTALHLFITHFLAMISTPWSVFFNHSIDWSMHCKHFWDVAAIHIEMLACVNVDIKINGSSLLHMVIPIVWASHKFWGHSIF